MIFLSRMFYYLFLLPIAIFITNYLTQLAVTEYIKVREIFFVKSLATD